MRFMDSALSLCRSSLVVVGISSLLLCPTGGNDLFDATKRSLFQFSHKRKRLRTVF